MPKNEIREATQKQAPSALSFRCSRRPGITPTQIHRCKAGL